MKCDEVQPMQGAYLDSELDARTALEIEQHLNSCPDCSKFFAEEERLDAWMKAGLNQGAKTAELWDYAEQAVREAAQKETRCSPLPSDPLVRGSNTRMVALAQQWRAWSFRLSKAWAGLAVVWLVILFLNVSDRQSGSAPLAVQQSPSTSEVRFALKQQRLLMADLALTSEPAKSSQLQTVPPSPRSERNRQNLNS
ncbi:MAG TPA: zf-HC2 domain-containing protein [Candidatus Limnocylindrales bacterium]|nr:zf-HC2 domain-containing protein [Candidatus Limnocylindrales bacterium]